MNIVARYIDKDGYVKTYVAQVKHGLQDPKTINAAYEEIIRLYNENIILIRGYTEDIDSFKKSSVSLQTDKFSINIGKRNLSYNELKEPAFGSVGECIKRNLTIDFQALVGRYNPFGGNIVINLIDVNTADDVHYIFLTEVRDIGLYTYVYKLDFTFTPEWSSTCDTCINGMAHIKSELERISNQLNVS